MSLAGLDRGVEHLRDLIAMRQNFLQIYLDFVLDLCEFYIIHIALYNRSEIAIYTHYNLIVASALLPPAEPLFAAVLNVELTMTDFCQILRKSSAFA